MNQKPDPQFLEKLLSESHILIVDSIPSARMALASNLSSLGADRQRMSLVSSIREARAAIKQFNPKLVFADFAVAGESSLDLIQEMRNNNDASAMRDKVFVLVTSDASQSAVARAAEEDVDTFIIKPYTLDTLKRILSRVCHLKLNPTKYLLLIEEGKKLLFAGKANEAIEQFSAAMWEHEEPTLACFYHGQAEAILQAVENAKLKYKEGLSFNQIHYKCLVGLYELLLHERLHNEAYEVVRKLAQYFPANPKRLTQVVKLAVQTENFKDIPEYYEIFKLMDKRPEELTKHVCAALVVAGKYYLKRKDTALSEDFFEKASISCAGHTHFLVYIVDAFIKMKLSSEASKYVRRLNTIAPLSRNLRIAEFLQSTLIETGIELSLKLGLKLIDDGGPHPLIYEQLILLSCISGNSAQARTFADEATSRFPAYAEQFKRAMKCENEMTDEGAA